jgi:hypothetical protein
MTNLIHQSRLNSLYPSPIIAGMINYHSKPFHLGYVRIESSRLSTNPPP